MKKPTYKSLLGMSVKMVYEKTSFDAYVAAVDKDIGITLKVLDKDDPNTIDYCGAGGECFCINIKREKEHPKKHSLYKLSARKKMNVLRSMILKGTVTCKEYEDKCQKPSNMEWFSVPTPCAFK